MPKSHHIETISHTIREQILAGAFQPYNILPSRKALAEEFHATPDTIAKGITLLQSEGLLTSQSGRTIRILPPRERITTTEETFRDYMRTLGFEVVVEHLLPASPTDSRPPTILASL